MVKTTKNNTQDREMLLLIVSLLFVSSLYAVKQDYHEQLDLMTPLNLNLTEGGYVITGALTTRFFGNLLPTRNFTMVLDTNNNRMVYDLGNGQGGVQVVTNDGAYFYGNPLFANGKCMKVNGWNYPKQVEGYRLALSRPGSTTNKAEYAGNVDDVATCKHGLSAVFEVKQDIITSLFFSQNFNGPFGPNGSSLCTKVQGLMQFDLSTIDRNVDRINSYFTLPSDCATTTIDYCSTAYPAGNACDTVDP
jgi:hypothetical protein